MRTSPAAPVAPTPRSVSSRSVRHVHPRPALPRCRRRYVLIMCEGRIRASLDACLMCNVRLTGSDKSAVERPYHPPHIITHQGPSAGKQGSVGALSPPSYMPTLPRNTSLLQASIVVLSPALYSSGRYVVNQQERLRLKGASLIHNVPKRCLIHLNTRLKTASTRSSGGRCARANDMAQPQCHPAHAQEPGHPTRVELPGPQAGRPHPRGHIPPQREPPEGITGRQGTPHPSLDTPTSEDT
jgi:hypothetical protein